MKKSLMRLSLISAIAVLGLSACNKKAHDDHMPPPQAKGETQNATPPAMSDMPSEVRAVGDLKIEVQGAWARATVAGQNMGGAFVNLTSDQDATLVGATSSVSDKVELHTMKMDGEKMLMAQVSSIPLPANTQVKLKPGSLHLMFMGLKQPLTEGQNVAITLKIKLSSGHVETLSIQAPVKSLAHSAMHQ